MYKLMLDAYGPNQSLIRLEPVIKKRVIQSGLGSYVQKLKLRGNILIATSPKK